MASTIERPGNVTAIGVLTIISGVGNVIAGIVFLISSIGLILAVIGCFTLPLSLLPIALGVIEIIHGVKLLSNPPQPVELSRAKTIAILQICTILYLNLISVVTGILSLVFYNDSEVEGYFTRINHSK